MIPDLPAPLAEFFEATNGDDPERIAACFSRDAKLNDEKQGYVGRAAIEKWAHDTRLRWKFQVQPFETRGVANAPIVSAHVTGDFPGNPVDLTYRFVLTDGDIVALTID